MKVSVKISTGNSWSASVDDKGNVLGIGQLTENDLSHLNRGQSVSVSGCKLTPQDFSCSVVNYFDPSC